MLRWQDMQRWPTGSGEAWVCVAKQAMALWAAERTDCAYELTMGIWRSCRAAGLPAWWRRLQKWADAMRPVEAPQNPTNVWEGKDTNAMAAKPDRRSDKTERQERNPRVRLAMVHGEAPTRR